MTFLIDKDRESNIELLRIIAMGGVILLHYVASAGELLANVSRNSPNFFLLIILNQLCVCAVDLFIFISGFFSYKVKSVSIRKSIQLLVEVSLLQSSRYLISSIIKHEGLSAFLLYSFIPRNYFVLLYVAIMLISPFINCLFNSLDKHGMKQFVLISLFLFSIHAILIDILGGIVGNRNIWGASMVELKGTGSGYTIINFMLMYVMGAYFGRFGFKICKKKYGIFFVINLFVLVLWKILEINIGRSIGAESYENPLIILEAVLVFAFFYSDIHIKSSAINLIAKGAFTVYLIHGILIRQLNLTRYLTDNVLLFLARLLLSIIFIYTLCCLVGIVYLYVEKIVFDWIENKIGFYKIEA